VQDKIQNLDKLYSLYVNVIQTIQGYGELLWTDVVSNIEEMSNAVNSFQGRSKTLPKALRDWPAYRDCRCAAKQPSVHCRCLPGCANWVPVLP
jgi:dynein heavy chain, axonemal